MADFKVGDAVTLDGSTPGTVRFGPVTGFAGIVKYVVEVESTGIHQWTTARRMDAVPAFAVGNVVAITHRDGEHTIKAGPFNNQYGDEWWVVSNGSADSAPTTASLTLVRKGEPAASRYVDCDGDEWIAREINGVTRAQMVRDGGRPDMSSSTLDYVREAWGPLTPA